MRELIFYPFIKWKDKDEGKYTPVFTDYKGGPGSVFWRSQSFIDINYFTESLPMIKYDELDEKSKEYFCRNSISDDDLSTYIYELSYDKACSIGSNYGIVSGYVPLDELTIYYSQDNTYDQNEYLHWEMSKPLPSEVFLEMPDDEKKKYGRIYTVNRYSKEYICSILAEVLDDMNPFIFEKEYEMCYLILYSF